MTLALLAGMLAGLVIGVAFRVPALLVASLAVILAGAAICAALSVPLGRAFSVILYTVLVMQGAYLAGLGISSLLQRENRDR